MNNKNNTRIAKNAALLYFRMLLTMVVSLYTSRVVLQTLGVEDYGIYNVVAGFVTMFGFLLGAMSSATQRFLSFEMGKEKDKNMSGIFSMSMNIHLLIAVIVLIIGETFGLWFLNSKLNIPLDRVNAAQWVYQLSLVSLVITILSVPYNALIIAHENMGVFAKVSIVDVMLKLIIVYMLTIFGVDKLILYSVLSLFVVITIFLIYRYYNLTNFEESRYKVYWDKELFHTLLSYTGWNLWGNIAAVLSNQGVNILLNLFFGPSINAARGLAFQVSGAVNKFVQNLQAAINPQIIKSYSSNNVAYMHQLVCYSAKYNFFVLFFIALPVLIHTDFVLELWLDQVPEYTALFIKLIIYSLLINSLTYSLMTAAQATGKIKLYQFVVGGILLLNVPISYIILNNGGSPETVFYVTIWLALIALFARLYLISKLINLSIYRFIYKAILPAVLSCSLSYLIVNQLTSEVNEIHTFVISLVIISSLNLTIIFSLGLSRAERNYIYKFILKFSKKVL